MATGKEIVNLALKHVGEQYVLGAVVPKDDPAWDGPWDCAEFVSWCVYQTAKVLYGCDNDRGEPATADAYTGFWGRDARSIGREISLAEAGAHRRGRGLAAGTENGAYCDFGRPGRHGGGPLHQFRGHSPHPEQPPLGHGHSHPRRHLRGGQRPPGSRAPRPPRRYLPADLPVHAGGEDRRDSGKSWQTWDLAP